MMAQQELSRPQLSITEPSMAPGAPDAPFDPALLTIQSNWNATKTIYPFERCIHELFESQVQRDPGAIAATYEGESCTYGKLDTRADRVADYLRAHGVGPEVLVGLCIDRSIEMLVALLGILKAGGAYVPMDPAWPKQRLDVLIKNARLSHIITESSFADLLTDTGPVLHCLDQFNLILDEPEGKVPTTPQSSVNSSNLAYVLHTSGSTGTPKGVQVSHQALVNLLCSMRDTVGMGPADTMLAVTTITFDIAGLELFLPLITGARVVIAGRADSSSGNRLSELIAESGATIMQATPATWQLLLASRWKGSPGLKVLCGGEAMPADLAALLATTCGELWNVYGPTETTVWSTAQQINAVETPISIGRPLANTAVYILSDHLHPLAVGESGELYIGGSGLARGYLNRSDLTAQRFVPDPFTSTPGERMYRTGDLARRLPDGRIECLGRIDHQVKIRGFRIELGDIEAALRQHPDVMDAVADVLTGPSGDKQIVAFVVRRDKKPLGDLRGHLSALLPSYMIPGAFVKLDSIPLTSSGKVDRRLLKMPVDRDAAAQSEYAPPETPTEKWLVETWQNQLGVTRIGIRDSFFEIGGQSLIAARIFMEIEKQLGRNLPPSTLFQAPTIGGLGAILDEEAWKPEWECLVAIRPNGTRPPFFCVHGAMAHVLFCDILSRLTPEEIPFFGLQSRGVDGKEKPFTRVEDMAEFYLREIRSVQPSGPYYLGGYSLGGAIALEMAQQLLRQGQEVAIVVMINSDCPVRSPHFPRRSSLFESHLIPFVLRVESRLLAMRRLGPTELLRRKGNRLRELRNDRAEFADQRPNSDETKDVQLRIFNLNRAAERAYRPQPYPGRITYLYSAERHPEQFDKADLRLAWSDFALGGFDLNLVPGNHLSMRYEPHVNVLADKLTKCLNRAYGEFSLSSKAVDEVAS